MGGGGGGGDGGYSERQAKIESDKQAARDRLNQTFGMGAGGEAAKSGREALYSTVRNNAFTAGRRGIDEGFGEAKRKAGFDLFARGLNGGSEDINQNALLNRTYNQGLIDLGGRADSVKNNLQSSDESARLGLLQSINSGTDESSAISSGINQMQNAANSAEANANGVTLGDLFANSGATYLKSQQAQGIKAGQQSIFNMMPNGTYKGSGGVLSQAR